MDEFLINIINLFIKIYGCEEVLFCYNFIPVIYLEVQI